MPEVDPILSVLILTYNHVKYIEQSILSVLEQKTKFKYEILIGDDHSNDGTSEIVDKIAKLHPKLIRVIRGPKNLGALKNESTLINEAKGKYIALLEGDDYWNNNLKIEIQISFLENNPEYGLVHTDVNHYFESTNKTTEHVNKTNSVTVPEGNIFNNLMNPEPFFIMTATTCFRTELVKKYFDYNLAINSNWPLTDLPLWFDLSYNSKVHYINCVTATYRLLNESASRTNSKEKHFNYITKLQEMKEYYFKKYNVPKEIIDKIRVKYYKNILKYGYVLKNKETVMLCKKYFLENKVNLSIKEKAIIAISRFI